MRRPAFLLAAMAALALVLTPVLVEAKPGGGSSSGSRGSRTHTAPPPTQTAPGAAQRMDRTATQPGTPATTAAGRPGAAPAAAPSRGFFGSFGGAMLMGGLIGGLLGFGLFGGGAGIGAILGMLLQIALIGGLIYLVVRLVRRRQQPATAGGPQGYAFQAQPEPRQFGGTGGMMGAAPAAAPVEVTPGDFQAFERTLVDLNAAWSKRDLAAMRAVATPEMVSYFAQDLRDLEARNWRNETRDVRLEQGDLAEAWHEDGEDYATVAMRVSMLDATFDNATNQVVEGSTTQRTESTEIWTFVRKGPGGRWMLSAIQQTAAA